MKSAQRAALWRIVLWTAPVMMCVGGLLTGLCIRNLVRVVREAELVRLPLVEKQEVSFHEAGRVVLSEEGPRFSRRFAGLAYELSTNYGSPVEGRRVLFRATSSGFSTVRREVRTFEIPSAGRYVLRVQKLGAAQEGDSRHGLVFSRPHLFKVILNILGILLGSGLFIAGVVFLGLRLAGKVPAK